MRIAFADESRIPAVRLSCLLSPDSNHHYNQMKGTIPTELGQLAAAQAMYAHVSLRAALLAACSCYTLLLLCVVPDLDERYS